MPLSQDDVQKIASYACIALDSEELEHMTSYLHDAFEMIEPILSYTDEDVEPTFHPEGVAANVTRIDAEDTARAFTREDALHSAASTRDGQFRVPSILSGGER